MLWLHAHSDFIIFILVNIKTTYLAPKNWEAVLRILATTPSTPSISLNFFRHFFWLQISGHNKIVSGRPSGGRLTCARRGSFGFVTWKFAVLFVASDGNQFCCFANVLWSPALVPRQWLEGASFVLNAEIASTMGFSRAKLLSWGKVNSPACSTKQVQRLLQAMWAFLLQEGLSITFSVCGSQASEMSLKEPAAQTQ